MQKFITAVKLARKRMLYKGTLPVGHGWERIATFAAYGVPWEVWTRHNPDYPRIRYKVLAVEPVTQKANYMLTVERDSGQIMPSHDAKAMAEYRPDMAYSISEAIGQTILLTDL